MAEHNARIGIVETAVVMRIRIAGGVLQRIARRGGLNGSESGSEGPLTLIRRAERAARTAKCARASCRRRSMAMPGFTVQRVRIGRQSWRTALVSVTRPFAVV